MQTVNKTNDNNTQGKPFAIFFVFINPFVPISIDLRLVQFFVLQQKVPSLFVLLDEMELQMYACMINLKQWHAVILTAHTPTNLYTWNEIINENSVDQKMLSTLIARALTTNFVSAFSLSISPRSSKLQPYLPSLFEPLCAKHCHKLPKHQVMSKLDVQLTWMLWRCLQHQRPHPCSQPRRRWWIPSFWSPPTYNTHMHTQTNKINISWAIIALFD